MRSAALPSLAVPRRSVIALLWLASAVVLAACVLASFRRGVADDWMTAWIVNGPRVSFAACAGAALGLAGSRRLARGDSMPLYEIRILGVASGAAGAGLLAAQFGPAANGYLSFAFGAALGALAIDRLILTLDRPRRWTNPVLGVVLAGLAGIVALAGTYARERRDGIAPLVAWLLGDPGHGTFAAAAVLAPIVLVLVALGCRNHGSKSADWIEGAALAVSIGAAGPLAFAGTLAPRAVFWLTGDASAPQSLVTASLCTAATVAAIDAVPRLLVGGYDFPWNLPAALLAVPIFLGWNRQRLRGVAGPAHGTFEFFELVGIAAMTVGAIALIVTLSDVIRLAT